MSNYQLYRTNVKLGGQMKWDLTIEGAGDMLYVNDFKISPISELAPFNRYKKDNLLNYSILEDIKAYYSLMKGSFYQEYTDPSITTLEPLMITGEEMQSQYKDLHNGTLEMGMKRARYNVHGKQLEFLCPVWYEGLEDGHWLSFHISLRGTNIQGEWIDIATKKLHLKPSNQKVHDKFVQRFNEYTKTIKSDNKCLNINLEDRTAFVTGIHVPSGTLKTTEAMSLTNNLLKQERLLMEADDLLLQEYENREMIVKQLINFNFVLDLDEMVPASLLSMMLGKDFTLAVHVYDVSEDSATELEMRDFDTRYEFIPCVNTNGVEDPEFNVYDELLDYMNIGLIDKGKIQQPHVHWSLADGEDYIFNLYPGFGGVVEIVGDNGELIKEKLKKVYQNSPDIWVKPTNTNEALSSNSINWIKWVVDDGDIHLNLNHPSLIDSLDAMEALYKEQAVALGEWVNNIKHEPSKETKKFIFAWYDDVVLSKLQSSNLMQILVGDSVVYCKVFNDFVILFAHKEYLHEVSYVNFMGVLQSIEDSEPWMTNLYKWMVATYQPKIVCFENILKYRRADGPSVATHEMQHYVVRDQPSYLFRYDGNIKPALRKIDGNLMYLKTTIHEEEMPDSIYTKWDSFGFPKTYPSVGYFAFDGHELVDNSGEISFADAPLRECIDRPYEYKWFNTSSAILLKPVINAHISSPGTDDTKGLALQYIMSLYDVDADKATYILNQYDMKTDWEYASLTDIDNYIYHIKLTLK